MEDIQLEEKENGKGWADVFEYLVRDKARLLHPTRIRDGKKVKMDVEVIFFLGNIRAELTDKGWKFQLQDNSKVLIS